MLTFTTNRQDRNCEGQTRRDFLQVGGLGLGTLGLPGLLAARAEAAKQGHSIANTSVVWLWLNGGPSHIETFDPKMTAPSDYRSITGEVKTTLPGVTLGGNWAKTAQMADKMAFVRSFAHNNSSHGGGTQWVMTGYNDRNNNGGELSRPSIGSIAAKYRGASNPETGMPTYVQIKGTGADGASFLGTAYEPFGTDREAKRNMELRTPMERLSNRRNLLREFDRFRQTTERSEVMEGLTAFEQQAFDLMLGKAPDAFDLSKEDPRVVQKYTQDPGGGIGKQMLIARRLCEAGCGFVTVGTGGWDMHRKIKKGTDRREPPVDHAVAAFLEDVHQRGLSDNILLVITGEFGRTPKINDRGPEPGRDHWAPLSTLALAGGGLQMGQVVGKSAPKADVPATTPIGPQDLMATVFTVLGIPQNIQFIDRAGRPVYMIEEGKPIPELV